MIRNFIKAHMTAGLTGACRHLLSELAVQRRHHSSIRRLKHFPSGSYLRLNVGCGANVKAGWINIDLWAEQADLHLDLREALPFPDDSVSLVYSEHFFEYLEYPNQAMNFLVESWRVLLPGGIFSVGVPDTEWPVRAYVACDEEYFRLAEKTWHPKWCDTRMHHLNYHFRQGNEHKYAYDFETLARVLGAAGFVSIVRRPYDAELDCEARKVGTLYMEARKPKRA